MEYLITGSTSFVGQHIDLDGARPTHKELDLTNYDSVKRYKWDGNVIVHCANAGQYGRSTAEDLKANVQMFTNMRLRWPDAKIIAFGSGAMYDRSRDVIRASEYDDATPTDYYGLSKRKTVDMADVTLIPFGIYGDTRFVKECRTGKVTIYKDMDFSWVNASDLTLAVLWTQDKGGRFNLCPFDMTLTEVARREGAKITYLTEGMGHYTGRRSAVPLTKWPKD